MKIDLSHIRDTKEPGEVLKMAPSPDRDAEAAKIRQRQALIFALADAVKPYVFTGEEEDVWFVGADFRELLNDPTAVVRQGSRTRPPKEALGDFDRAFRDKLAELIIDSILEETGPAWSGCLYAALIKEKSSGVQA